MPHAAPVLKPSAYPRVDSAILGSTTAAVALRPPLKWAGGKRWQVPHLRPLRDRHHARRLVEPFCGGLAVTLGLMPSRALLNDVNPHAVNFFRWLKRGLKVDIALLNDAVTYYASRTRFNELLANGQADAAEAAALFYYLNRTGYNGLCRSIGRANSTFRSAATSASGTELTSVITSPPSLASNSRTSILK